LNAGIPGPHPIRDGFASIPSGVGFAVRFVAASIIVTIDIVLV
jgi:hypothetical protein